MNASCGVNEDKVKYGCFSHCILAQLRGPFNANYPLNFNLCPVICSFLISLHSNVSSGCKFNQLTSVLSIDMCSQNLN